ncbi:hypothetical protein IAT38_000556 [Cryptococcus sp. DSM 104549]
MIRHPYNPPSAELFPNDTRRRFLSSPQINPTAILPSRVLILTVGFFMNTIETEESTAALEEFFKGDQNLAVLDPSSMVVIDELKRQACLSRSKAVVKKRMKAKVLGRLRRLWAALGEVNGRRESYTSLLHFPTVQEATPPSSTETGWVIDDQYGKYVARSTSSFNDKLLRHPMRPAVALAFSEPSVLPNLQGQLDAVQLMPLNMSVTAVINSFSRATPPAHLPPLPLPHPGAHPTPQRVVLFFDNNLGFDPATKLFSLEVLEKALRVGTEGPGAMVVLSRAMVAEMRDVVGAEKVEEVHAMIKGLNQEEGREGRVVMEFEDEEEAVRLVPDDLKKDDGTYHRGPRARR